MLEYNQKSITLDTETRSLNLLIADKPFPNYNSVWDIAWIECSGDYVNKENQYYIDVPNLNLSELVKTLTKFNAPEYHKQKKNCYDVWEKVKKVLYDKDYLIIGQNIIGFDVFMLGNLAKRCGEDIDWSFLERVIDTRALGMAYKNEIEKPRAGSLIDWQFKVLNDRSLKGKVSQTALMKDLGLTSVSEGARHSAIVDVKDTFNIYKSLKRKLNL